MTYFKVDDKLHSHVKAMRAGAPALGLWVLSASWVMDQQTDGWVPEYAALRLDPNAEQSAAALVRAGLWHEDERDGERGWQFHEWDGWQHSVEYLEERRRRNADRMRTKRANEAAQQAADQGKQAVREHSANTTRTVLSTPTTTTTTKNTPSAADAAGESFQAFWSRYPRKVGKQAAAKAFTKALRHTDADTIVAGLAAAVAGWTACGTESRFIPHPSTWLNEGRWDDQDQLLPGDPRQDQAAGVQSMAKLPPLPTPPPDLTPRQANEWLKAQRREQREQLAGGAK